jgi:predicted transposase YdaD
VLRPPPGCPEAPIIFTETQFQGSKSFYARWLAAIFLYLYRKRETHHWRAVVVFPPSRGRYRHRTPYEGLFACGLLHRVYLRDLLGRQDLSFDARLARLIILDAALAPAEARAPVAAPTPWSKPFWCLNSPPYPARRSAS